MSEVNRRRWAMNKLMIVVLTLMMSFGAHAAHMQWCGELSSDGGKICVRSTSERGKYAGDLAKRSPSDKTVWRPTPALQDFESRIEESLLRSMYRSLVSVDVSFTDENAPSTNETITSANFLAMLERGKASNFRRWYLHVYTNGLDEAVARRETELFNRECEVSSKCRRLFLKVNPADQQSEEFKEFAQAQAELEGVAMYRRHFADDCLDVRNDASARFAQKNRRVTQVYEVKQSGDDFGRFLTSLPLNVHTPSAELKAVMAAMRDLRLKHRDRFFQLPGLGARAKRCVLCRRDVCHASECVVFTMTREAKESSGTKLRHEVGFFVPCCDHCLKHTFFLSSAIRKKTTGLHEIATLISCGYDFCGAERLDVNKDKKSHGWFESGRARFCTPKARMYEWMGDATGNP